MLIQKTNKLINNKVNRNTAGLSYKDKIRQDGGNLIP